MSNLQLFLVVSGLKAGYFCINVEEETYLEDQFSIGSVPISVTAKVYGRDASWVRAGIVSGWLPIGKATRDGKLVTTIEEMDSKYGRINYYISPKRLYEETGYVWKGEKTVTELEHSSAPA